MKQQLFNPGRILSTPGALEMAETGVNLLGYLRRHLSGDWGDLGTDDKAENDFSVLHGYRILSAYQTTAGRLWVVTEVDRSATTFLLPEEY